MKRLSRRLPLHLASFGLIFLFLLHATERIDIPMLRALERNLYDARLSLTTPNIRDDRVVIVDIDEKSLAREGHWPWSRDKLARMVDRLFAEYKIRLLGFDVVFAERDDDTAISLVDHLLSGEHGANARLRVALEGIKPSLEHDRLFAASMKNRPVVLGFVTRNQDWSDSVGVLPAPAFEANRDDPAVQGLVTVTRHTGNLQELQNAAAAGGFFVNPLVDEDGIYRRLPMLLQQNGLVYESLPLAMFRTLIGFPPIQLEVGADYSDTAGGKIEALVMEGFRIPTDERGAVLIPFLGQQGSFPYVSATDVLNGTVPIEQLQDRIVLVGATAAGLLDMRATPVQNVFPGVEINANLIAAMLDQRFKERPAWILGVEALQILLTGVVLGVLVPRLSAAMGTLVAALLLGALLALYFLAWQRNLALESAAPLMLVFLLYSIQMFFGYLLEGRAMKHLTGVFGQYVPPEIVREMSQQQSDFGISGETREMTVLFTDVRGFTTISESVPPAQLSLLMNELLTPLTRVIHQHKGTIDKYMGDCIMAFWGAPLHDPHHARHALEAALDLLRAVKEIQVAFKARGWPPMKLGVGLNTGPMSVGNMGSEFRMAYTVLGDAVNLGSRLEGLTKQYGVYLIVSETTRAAAPEFAYRELDRVRVKGKNEPVAIYEPLGPKDDLTETERDELARHDAALAHYRKQEWREAAESFRSLAAEHPKRMIYGIYQERIALFEQEPPGEDWDGAFTHVSK
jgi:adenylate cyclase